MVARSISSLGDVEKEINTVNPDVQILKAEADITDFAAVEEVYRKVKDTFGTVDVLVNNAGAFVSNGSLADAVAKDWWKDWVSDFDQSYAETSSDELFGE